MCLQPLREHLLLGRPMARRAHRAQATEKPQGALQQIPGNFAMASAAACAVADPVAGSCSNPMTDCRSLPARASW